MLKNCRRSANSLRRIEAFAFALVRTRKTIIKNKAMSAADVTASYDEMNSGEQSVHLVSDTDEHEYEDNIDGSDKRCDAHDEALCVDVGVPLYNRCDAKIRNALRRSRVRFNERSEMSHIVHKQKLDLEAEVAAQERIALTAHTFVAVSLALAVMMIVLDIVVSDIGRHRAFEKSHIVLFVFSTLFVLFACATWCVSYVFRAGPDATAVIGEQRRRKRQARMEVLEQAQAFIKELSLHLSDVGCTQCVRSVTLPRLIEYLHGHGWINAYFVDV